jgi:hypothetical protein
MKFLSFSVIAVLSVILVIVDNIKGFKNAIPAGGRERPRTTRRNNDNNFNDDTKPKTFFEDLKGMFRNFDDVVDDFVYKRMGAGEQWYGKRKYNPSGRVDGDYNGMGRSDYFRIEIARVQKEEMELRKQRRLEEEARKRGGEQ